MFAIAGAKPDQSLEFSVGLLHGLQLSMYVSHHLLPPEVNASRTLELNVKVGVKRRHADSGSGILCCANPLL